MTLTAWGIARAEWLKLKTLRSTWITLAAAIAVLIAASLLISNRMHGDLGEAGHRFGDLPDPSQFPVRYRTALITLPLRGFGLTQLIIGVLGVLTITGEYATGMIRATFTAVPKRLPVLAAKLVVFAALSFTAMMIAVLGAFFSSQAVLGSYGVGLGAPNTLSVVFGLAGYLSLVSLLGLGLGFIVRSTAGGIASLVGILLVAPGILAAFNTSWSTTANHYFPLNAGLAMFSANDGNPGDLSPSGGLLTMLVWVASSLVVAAVLVKRRDA